MGAVVRITQRVAVMMGATSYPQIDWIRAESPDDDNRANDELRCIQNASFHHAFRLHLISKISKKQ